MIKKIVLVVLLLAVIIGFFYVRTFTVKEIVVNGCNMSDEEEVREAVKSFIPGNNTLFLYVKEKFSKVKDVAFVAKLDINIDWKNRVVVDVYEKSLAGCVEYMEQYIYFDNDGRVLETGKEKIPGIPIISGLNISNWQINEKLPVDNAKKFDLILTITQLIEKYELRIDGITFQGEEDIVLHVDGINVELGNGDNLAVQMMNLGSILDGLKGKKGTLYMKDFNSPESMASFKSE